MEAAAPRESAVPGSGPFVAELRGRDARVVLCSRLVYATPPDDPGRVVRVLPLGAVTSASYSLDPVSRWAGRGVVLAVLSVAGVYVLDRLGLDGDLAVWGMGAGIALSVLALVLRTERVHVRTAAGCILTRASRGAGEAFVAQVGTAAGRLERSRSVGTQVRS